MAKTRYRSSNQHMFPMLEMISRVGAQHGIGFTLLMEYPGKHECHKDYAIYPRFGQPCQGGDMRRYGKKSTQPHNERPNDLSQPFPEGTPSAIAFHNLFKNQTGLQTGLFEALVSDDSPWRKGFGGRQNILTYLNPEGHPIGYILKSLQVDPTVLVNGVNFLNTLDGGGWKNYSILIDAGATPNEALCILMMNGQGVLSSIVETWDYRHPPVLSARRFFEGRPNDLSGGTYANGADYNRTYVQDVFLGDPKRGGIVWKNEMTKRTSGMTLTPKVFVDVSRELFAEAIHNEPPIIDEPYVYRDDSGEILPYPKAALVANPSLKVSEQKAKVA